MARSKKMKGIAAEELIPGYPTKGYILHGKCMYCMNLDLTEIYSTQ